VKTLLDAFPKFQFFRTKRLPRKLSGKAFQRFGTLVVGKLLKTQIQQLALLWDGRVETTKSSLGSD